MSYRPQYFHADKLHPYGADGGIIGIDTLMCHGYWEYADGSEGGELLFDALPDGRLELMDYDGAFELPRPVVAALTAHGVVVGEEF
jgi:hypothetical protein